MEDNKATGKTTRTVDHAIQLLFTEGTIYVPSKSQMESEDYHRGGRNKNLIVLDPDWQVDGRVQQDLLNRIIRRLKFEHRIEKLKYNINGTTISIIDPKFVKDGI